MLQPTEPPGLGPGVDFDKAICILGGTVKIFNILFESYTA